MEPVLLHKPEGRRGLKLTYEGLSLLVCTKKQFKEIKKKKKSLQTKHSLSPSMSVYSVSRGFSIHPEVFHVELRRRTAKGFQPSPTTCVVALGEASSFLALSFSHLKHVELVSKYITWHPQVPSSQSTSLTFSHSLIETQGKDQCRGFAYMCL